MEELDCLGCCTGAVKYSVAWRRFGVGGVVVLFEILLRSPDLVALLHHGLQEFLQNVFGLQGSSGEYLDSDAEMRL